MNDLFQEMRFLVNIYNTLEKTISFYDFCTFYTFVQVIL